MKKTFWIIATVLIVGFFYLAYFYHLSYNSNIPDSEGKISMNFERKRYDGKTKTDRRIYIGDFLFDTGYITSNYSDGKSVVNKSKVLLWLGIDTNRKFRFKWLYLFDELKIENITIKNVMCSIKEDFSSDNVMGLNIIDKCNWFFDFDNEKYKCFDVSRDIDTQLLEDYKYLEYHKDIQGQYITSLNINGEIYENVVFDTGSGVFMSMTKENIEKLSKKYTPNIIERTMIHTNSISTVYCYRFPNQDFKEYSDLDSIDIVLMKRNCIGKAFFDNKKIMYLDNKNMKIYFK